MSARPLSLAEAMGTPPAFAALQPPSTKGQMVPYGKPAAKGMSLSEAMSPVQPQTGTVELVAARIQAAPPVPTSQLATREVVALSDSFAKEITTGDGALSVKTHQKQMEDVEVALKGMVANLKDTTSKLSGALQEFIEFVGSLARERKEIAHKVVDDFKAGTLSGDALANARAINLFISEMTKAQYEDYKMIVDAIKDAGTAINEKTKEALGVIFYARNEQIKLVKAKADVICQLEKHKLELVIQKEKADAELQKEQFRQWETTIKLLQEAKDADQKRALEFRKQELEEVIQTRSLYLKEEESRNKMELELATHELEVKKEGNRQKNAETALKINKALEESKIKSAEVLKHHEIAAQERAAARNTAAQKDVAMHQANMNFLGNVIKPAGGCVTM